MSALNETLLTAVRSGQSQNRAFEAGRTHLSAQRRIYESGVETWVVHIGGSFHPAMTHITDSLSAIVRNFDAAATTDAISELIAGCWDPAWDEIPDGFGGCVTRAYAEAEAA